MAICSHMSCGVHGGKYNGLIWLPFTEGDRTERSLAKAASPARLAGEGFLRPHPCPGDRGTSQLQTRPGTFCGIIRHP